MRGVISTSVPGERARRSHSRGVIPCHIQPRSVIISIRNHAFGYPPAGVPGGDRNQGVHRPGRPRPRADPAAAAGRGRRGAAGLPAGGVRGRAVPHARAGRHHRPAPLPGAGPPVRPGGGRGGHLRLPRARRGPLPGPGRPGPGAAAALARAAARRHRQLPHRRRARYRMGQLAVPGLVTLADRGAARGVAGRGRLRHGRPPPHRARRGAGRAAASTSWPGCPRATPPSRSGSPTSASTPAPRCCAARTGSPP